MSAYVFSHNTDAVLSRISMSGVDISSAISAASSGCHVSHDGVGCAAVFLVDAEMGSRYATCIRGAVLTSMQAYHAEELAILDGLSISCNGNRVCRRLSLVAVAFGADKFLPCGKCMGLILEFGGPECIVLHYNPASDKTSLALAGDLMPYHGLKA